MDTTTRVWVVAVAASMVCVMAGRLGQAWRESGRRAHASSDAAVAACRAREQKEPSRFVPLLEGPLPDRHFPTVRAAQAIVDGELDRIGPLYPGWEQMAAPAEEHPGRPY
ncbi:hypothetical protein [Kitasatospora sp. CMC57]|uniref:hypothetical protein n=1 Tax=Kitasatospora sp. CMC57 TaxID=3231513 RepID=UPI0038B4785E